ncbi:hypothetical protein BDZ89DRAFT_1049927 [Hymenopellis radicata]|nr:hypothetical protein BDZ89DRAFT_1049927 [Hymenopellis radicata]
MYTLIEGTDAVVRNVTWLVRILGFFDDLLDLPSDSPYRNSEHPKYRSIMAGLQFMWEYGTTDQASQNVQTLSDDEIMAVCKCYILFHLIGFSITIESFYDCEAVSDFRVELDVRLSDTKTFLNLADHCLSDTKTFLNITADQVLNIVEYHASEESTMIRAKTMFKDNLKH